MFEGEFDLEAFQTVILENLKQVSENSQEYFEVNIGEKILDEMDKFSEELKNKILQSGMLKSKRALKYCLDNIRPEAYPTI